MPESMVERAGRAIYEQRNGHGCRAWRSLPRAHRDPYLADARAVMGAMIDGVTPKMIEAMEEMYMPMGDMRAAWDGAVFAALSEPKGG